MNTNHISVPHEPAGGMSSPMAAEALRQMGFCYVASAAVRSRPRKARDARAGEQKPVRRLAA